MTDHLPPEERDRMLLLLDKLRSEDWGSLIVGSAMDYAMRRHQLSKRKRVHAQMMMQTFLGKVLLNLQDDQDTRQAARRAVSASNGSGD